jgi:hypothetical protein
VNRLTVKHFRAVMVVCGLLLLALGALKGALGLSLDEQAEKWITNGLFVVAAIAFVQMVSLRRKAREAARKP